MKDINKVKESFLKTVRPEMSDMSYNTWFVPTGIRRIDEEDRIVYITAENDFAANILRTRYNSIIEDSFRKVLKQEYRSGAYKRDKERREQLSFGCRDRFNRIAIP